MVYNIQILRAIAALLVVHAHAAGAAGLNLSWDGGAHGVDLFFVISGYIIAYVSSLDADRFMLRRLIRIVPIYWSSTIALYALLLVAPHLFRSASADVELLVKSLLFLPDGTHVQTSDGIPHPTLAGGWTLNYEMYFYVVFAIALQVAPRAPIALASFAIVIVVFVVNTTGLDRYPEAHFYGYPIVFEFVFGMFAFHVVRWRERIAKKFRPSIFEKWTLMAVVIVGFLLLAFSEAVFGEARRWIVAGIPSFFVLVAAVVLERVHGLRVENRFALLVGEASYVLYLIQAYVIYGMTRLVLSDVSFTEIAGQLMTIPLLAFATIVAVGVYRFYEQPLLRLLKKRFLGRATGVPPA